LSFLAVFNIDSLLHIGVELSGGTLYQSKESTKIMGKLFFLAVGPERALSRLPLGVLSVRGEKWRRE